MASPVQVVLNPENYETARETPGGGDKQDFFAHRDGDFRAHKAALITQILGIVQALRAQSESDIGYVKVILRREAWAKSHRPLRALFRRDRTQLVGGGDLGVMIFEARPQRLVEIAEDIRQAEDDTRTQFNKTLDKDLPHPSGRRSETGAIERIELYGPEDRRDFSVLEAVNWLTNPVTGSGYFVELFDFLPARPDWDAYESSRQKLYQSFVAGLERLGSGLRVERLGIRTNRQTLLSVRLQQSTEQPLLLLAPPPQIDRHRQHVAPFDTRRDRHAQLLAFLEKHPLVRRIELPAIILPAADSIGREQRALAEIPVRDAGRTYPRIGIVDGGIGNCLSDWIIERWDLLDKGDVALDHGTFIGGLTVAGRSLNGVDVCPEPDGAELIDIAIFPDQNKAGAFANYFPYGVTQFFDELSTAVADARSRHRIRVFNMSLNIQEQATPARYGPVASRLDQISEDNDAIIVVSAGNTAPGNMRPEWPSDDTQALQLLAQSNNDKLLRPAESIRNVAVAALNPPNHPSSISHAPTRYTRRGPGLRTGVKPDFAGIGGSGTNQSPAGFGLFSILPTGLIADGCGTSYAAPSVAKALARLDSMIEGEVSRETLIALLAHHALLPKPLQSKALAGIARQLVGFGVPISADQMLESEDHKITLVFASRIRKDQQITFPFNWPASLTNADGRCKGRARLTIVSAPPLNPRFGAEFVRVNVDAALQQQTSDGRWKSQLDALYLPGKADAPVMEAELIEHGLKWSPVKVYGTSMRRGRGVSSNWRFVVKYLTRAGEEMPDDGVPFSAILSIDDLEGTRGIFNDMRQTLSSVGVQLAEIRTAARITARV